MKTLKTQTVAMLVICAAACGGDGGGTGPGPVVAAPTITTASTMIYVGQSLQFTATGSGTIRWGGDSPSVAAIDPSTGRATGVGIGRVTIWAENAGGRTTRQLRALPAFTGIWRGGYVVENCQASGLLAESGFCGRSVRVGERLEIALILYQTEDRVHGATFLLRPMAGFTFSLPGRLTDTTVGEDGQIRLAGFGEPNTGSPLKVNLENIRLESPAPGVLEGEFEQFWSNGGGDARVFARLDHIPRELGGPPSSMTTPLGRP